MPWILNKLYKATRAWKMDSLRYCTGFKLLSRDELDWSFIKCMKYEVLRYLRFTSRSHNGCMRPVSNYTLMSDLFSCSQIPITYKFKTSFENKSRSIAWFVSHCSTASKREKFAKDLAEYIDIDIYGKCGKLSCGKQTYLNRTDTSCYRMTEQKYKFYFSAENSV